MATLVFHGHLREIFPKPVEMVADTVAEMINGVCKQTKKLNPKLGQQPHLLRVLGFDTVESLFSKTDQKEIHIVPAFQGGKGGFLQIILGAVLIALAFIPGVAPIELGMFTITASSLFMTGALMLLGGLLQLLSPAPKMDMSGQGAQDPEASKYLGSPQNTVKIGTRIPIGYGLAPVYGQYISFNIESTDVSSGTVTTGNNPDPTLDANRGPFENPAP